MMTIDELLLAIRNKDSSIVEISKLRTIDPLTLRSKLLLHLPQFDNPIERIDFELETMASSIEKKQLPYKEWLVSPPVPILPLQELEFGGLSTELAKIFHEDFHYIGSFHPGDHYCLKYQERIVAMGSIDKDIFTRFFAFRWALPNIFSFFWSKLRRVTTPQQKIFSSYINPNLGFSGGSFKGAGFNKIPNTWIFPTYAYLEGIYRTSRFWRENYGTNSPKKLAKIIGPSYVRSKMLFKPLDLLVWRPALDNNSRMRYN